MKPFIIVLLALTTLNTCFAQNFTRRDSLQGGLRFERTSYDVLRYDLNITVNPKEKNIVGYNAITFKVVEPTQKIQVDLFENMTIDSIIYHNQDLNYTRDFDAVFINFPSFLTKNTTENIVFYYSGKPKEAKNAPWDGGFVFKKDSNNNDFIGVAVQGTGASLWYPCKDSQTDEPNNGASIKVAVPNGLQNVSNGRFKGSEDLKNGYTRWDWEVQNPINNYDITVNIANYTHFHDNYNGLDLDFYVLKENEEKAKKHFEDDVKPMLDCFQEKFGKYPFWEDGYKLVETSYLGMEHQSAIAYGNKYRKGYLGFDNSRTGIGMFFDYIIIHETGHEWFGNSITSKDIADMWIHEGFTTYTESVFVECQKGYEKALQYINGQAKNVSNNKPIIGKYGVNNEGSGDMYYKGALLLNTLRHVINNDELWWNLLYKFAETYKKQIIDTETVIAFFNQQSGKNLTPIFNQYLRYTNLPKLEIKGYKNRFQYRWVTDVENFEMPVEVIIEGKTRRLNATNEWQIAPIAINGFKNFNVATDKFFIKQ
ncbi:M1 family metallopeptidase [Flavobacterium sp.]|uniref:M1 family metallopeptidase n=1 Tax=Flavobacterium sp. TaxID=239 RepID=UPI0035299255